MYFSVTQNENCCGVAEVGGFDASRNDKPEELRKQWLEVMADNRVGLLQATTTAGARLQGRLLKESGWVEVRRFRNPKTGRTIISWHFTK